MAFALTGAEIRKHHRIEEWFKAYGVELKTAGADNLIACCPFHKEKSPSLSVSPRKQTFHCFGCHVGGDLVDLVSRMEGISIKDALIKLTPAGYESKRVGRNRPSESATPEDTRALPAQEPAPPAPESEPIGKVVATYEYLNEIGQPLFYVERIEPGRNGKRKEFRQYHKDAQGNRVYKMQGVRRVLYNLPNVLKAKCVVIVAGEKDADTLNSLGAYTATTNSGGEKNWLEGYADCLRDKEVVICGDNDETGREHVKLVLASLSGKVTNARVVFTPLGKDATEYLVDNLRAQGKTDIELCDAFDKLVADAPPLTKGIDLPIYSVEVLEQMYYQDVKNEENHVVDLGRWLPRFNGRIDPLSGGEMLTIVADTGTGKTAIAQNIAMAIYPTPTLFFELELSRKKMYQRTVGLNCGVYGKDVHRRIKAGETMDWRKNDKISHIYTCPISKMTPMLIESYINQAEMIMGVRPVFVVVDYGQLVVGRGGSRYEQKADVGESMRIIANSTGTVVCLLSQIGRPADSGAREIGLHDAKNAGEIENSSSLLLGAWRDASDPAKAYIKVVKSNNDEPGLVVPVRVMPGLRWVEEVIEQQDVPQSPARREVHAPLAVGLSELPDKNGSTYPLKPARNFNT